ncbi:uncharacterized protein PAC_00057 [Phialocephala subalpina]|uniref:Zn(2)-C6 fungal-type domain-containing protein n=1 Tax=Phialocephala subalpina TaxID=576137 RepID=A0A1L7WBN0_9HELO|nr:uncharacterized protein PAC_00057 [Phialocephala subalpina]
MRVQKTMHPRKAHLRSRNGCVQCKRRRVKCDESTPLCGPCSKHRIECSFASSLLTPPSPPLLRAPQYAPPLSPSSLMDLELLHNFTSKTYSTITCSSVISPSLREFYRTTYVQEAFAYDYFIHSILAVSAFHHVHQHRRSGASAGLEKYLIAAHTHHNTALRSFRQTLNNVTDENCSAMFGCASLITIMSYAQLHVTTIQPLSDSPRKPNLLVPEWFTLLRGIPLAVHNNENVKSGPMAPIFQRMKACGTGKVDSDISSYFKRLCAAFTQHSDAKVGRLCCAAVDKLRESFVNFGQQRESTPLLAWPATVHEEFVVLLKMSIQEAVLVFAQFCVLLFEIRGSWWVEGWAEYILERVDNCIVEERWREWLRWPSNVIYGKEREVYPPS